MVSEGSVTLPNGDTIEAGQGGSYCIGSDRYPVTIVGWTKSGKTIFYQAAKRARNDNNGAFSEAQSYLFWSNPKAPVQKATWRTTRHGSFYRESRERTGFIHTSGYDAHFDPSF